MNNFVQPGDSVEYTAPAGGVVSGTPVLIGQLLVVPAQTALVNVKFVGKTTGVFSVTKAGSQAWTEGAIVYWDSGNARFTTVATGNFRAGTAVEAVGAGASLTTGTVRLDGVSRVQEDT
jgi:predicted RecA/RadA family phage recombinase